MGKDVLTLNDFTGCCIDLQRAQFYFIVELYNTDNEFRISSDYNSMEMKFCPFCGTDLNKWKQKQMAKSKGPKTSKGQCRKA